MITNETEIRIALQAVLVSVLVVYGFWGCALVVLFMLLPWKPIFAVGIYLVQPLVDWRIQKAQDRHEKGIAQIEHELDNLLRTPRGTPSAPAAGTKTAGAGKPPQPPLSRPSDPVKSNLAAGILRHNMPVTAQDLSATMMIPPVIKNHVRSLPQGVFTNMDLEVEEVSFHGDTADACVRFQSPNVTELVIRQRYVLRKSGDQWQVESRQPANGAGKTPSQPLSTDRRSMQIT